MNVVDDFIKGISKLKPNEFANLARLMDIKLIAKVDTEEKFIQRDFNDILEEMINTFEKMNRTTKRRVIKIINSSGVKNNASNS